MAFPRVLHPRLSLRATTNYIHPVISARNAIRPQIIIANASSFVQLKTLGGSKLNAFQQLPFISPPYQEHISSSFPFFHSHSHPHPHHRPRPPPEANFETSTPQCPREYFRKVIKDFFASHEHWMEKQCRMKRMHHRMHHKHHSRSYRSWKAHRPNFTFPHGWNSHEWQNWQWREFTSEFCSAFRSYSRKYQSLYGLYFVRRWHEIFHQSIDHQVRRCKRDWHGTLHRRRFRGHFRRRCKNLLAHRTRKFHLKYPCETADTGYTIAAGGIHTYNRRRKDEKKGCCGPSVLTNAFKRDFPPIPNNPARMLLGHMRTTFTVSKPPKLKRRLFSTQIPPKRVEFRISAVPYALLGIFKSSAALNVISTITRMALTVLPISVRAHIIYMIREYHARNPNVGGWIQKAAQRFGGESNLTMRWNTMFFLPAIVILPFLLFGIAMFVSQERTPITGRRRIVMLSSLEESSLVSSVLDMGPTNPQGARDWISVMSPILNLKDEGYSTTTGRRMFLGGEVLDERDWRVRWVWDVLKCLEDGIPHLSLNSDGALKPDILRPPPTAYPLTPRERNEDLNSIHAEYDLMVIDRPELNAFSFGFAPECKQNGRPGVIVVFSGFIDEILKRKYVPSVPVIQETRTLFGNVQQTTVLPNLTPTALPTAEQTKFMAVLLSHELAHLVLSHTLESYANTSLLIPHISKMFSDVARTILYPLTALLGPFLNDAIGASMNESAAAGFGILGKMVNSCESRKLETEADIVALRLLSNAGIDPRFALDFWAGRMDKCVHDSSILGEDNSHLFHRHGGREEGWLGVGFVRSHPVDQERLENLRRELISWTVYNEMRI